MAITLIASTVKATADTNSVTTDAIDTTGANLIVIVESIYGGVTTPTDSKSNGSWTGLTAQTVNNESCRIYYHVAPTVGTGHTFTVTATAHYMAIAVFAFAGAHASAPFDVQNGSTGGGGETSRQTGEITPSEAGCVVVTGVMTDPGTAHTMSGYTSVQVNYAAGVNLGCGGSYLIQTTATPTNPTWTWTTGAVATAVIASFKSAAGQVPYVVGGGVCVPGGVG